MGCGFLIKKYFQLRLDEILVAGLLISMVVAEYISLFMGVSVVAGIVVMLFAVIGYIVCRKEVKNNINLFINSSIYTKLMCIMGILLLAIVFSVVAVQSPNYVDTGLYHAQSIRWIEEYGVVRGLGNLHHRFAYNSAFLCLQALFSWKTIIGQSLHGMNAYFAMLMLGYSIISQHVFRGESFSVSDAVKIIIPIYIFTVWKQLSSPNTDSMVLLLVVYIVAKWIDELEKGPSERNSFYAFLGLLVVAACTIKVSVAPMVLLLIKPIVKYIKQKDWLAILKWGLLVGVIILPYFARNVMISGYILYPYPSLDFFDVDWKMNQYTVICDSKEIMAWGRNLFDVTLADAPITYWLPMWFANIEVVYKVLLIINPLFLILIVIYAIKSKNIDVFLLGNTFVVSNLFWLLTAPYIRFGLEYILFGTCVVCGYMVKHQANYKVQKILVRGTFSVVGFMLVLYLLKCDTYRKFYPNDYPILGVNTIHFYNDIVINYPEGLANEGYYWYFPETPYPDYVELIELRGTDLADGFRIKPQYKNQQITAMGQIVD